MFSDPYTIVQCFSTFWASSPGKGKISSYCPGQKFFKGIVLARYVSVDGNIRNPALPVMPRHYQQNDEILFIKALLGQVG
jgi:hypothetical protein